MVLLLDDKAVNAVPLLTVTGRSPGRRESSLEAWLPHPCGRHPANLSRHGSPFIHSCCCQKMNGNLLIREFFAVSSVNGATVAGRTPGRRKYFPVGLAAASLRQTPG